MTRHPFIIYVTLLVVLSSANCFSEEAASPPALPEQEKPTEAETPVAPETKSTPESHSLFERWFDSFVDMRDKSSTHYMSMVRGLDAYFSGQKIEETSNGSYVKLDLNNTFYKGGEQSDGISLDARIELPNTEKHVKLFFSSDPEEDKTLEQKINNNATGQRIEKQNSVAGVEYAPTVEPTAWKHSFATGVKVRVKPVPFIRYKLNNQWQLNENWDTRFKQSFWNYQDKGLGATTNFVLERPLSAERGFVSETEAEFRDKENKYFYAQTFSDIHRLSTSSAIRYWVGALGESQPTSQVTSYLIGTQYRKTLYRDWILFSISPILAFPREEKWEATPSLTLDLQIFFTE